jgi:hypothetical protein
LRYPNGLAVSWKDDALASEDQDQTSKNYSAA